LKTYFKYLLYLIILNLLLAGAGCVFVTGGLNLEIRDIVILSASFSFIAALALYIFIRGQRKSPESQTFHTLISVSIKMLLDLILALIWFVVTKKTSPQAVLLFFVLYLTLTLFSVCIILKTLKNKSL
jgi:hypothetical protein